jgi:hypothetical protein
MDDIRVKWLKINATLVHWLDTWHPPEMCLISQAQTAAPAHIVSPPYKCSNPATSKATADNLNMNLCGN